MTRQSEEDRFARVCELYAFDESFAVSPSPRLPLPASPPLSPSSHLTLAGFDEAGRGALAGPVAVGCVHFDLPLQQPSYTRYDATKGIPVASGLVPDVVFPNHFLEHLAGVDDSKHLSPARREEMYHQITEVASWGIGWASAQEIDLLGIVPAISLAARRAYITMGERVDLLLCDRGLSLLGRGDAETREHGDLSSPRVSPSPRLRVPLSPRPPLPASPLSPELSFTKGDSRSLHIAAASILAKVARDRMMLNLHQRFPVYAFAANKGYGTPAHLAALRDNGPSAIHRRSFRVKE